MVECYLHSLEELVFLFWIPSIVVSSTVLTLLICDSKAERFDDDDPESAANRAKRAAEKKRREEMKKEQERMQEGLKRGEFRPVDNNETVNEVVSNWGAAQAMAAARGDDKYFDAPKPQSSDTPLVDSDSKKSKESREKKQQFRPRDDNETVNEVVSNWGAAQAMLQKKEGVANIPAKPPPPPPPPRPKEAPRGFRPRDDNETVNEVVSNWGAAQAMLQKKEGVANVPAKPPPPPPPPKPKEAPRTKIISTSQLNFLDKLNAFALHYTIPSPR